MSAWSALAPAFPPLLQWDTHRLRALVWVPQIGERARVVKALTEAGHEVVTALRETEVRQAFATTPVDVVLVAVAGEDDEPVRVARSLADAQGAFVLVLVPFRVEPVLARFYEAGADGDLIVPCSPPLLAARMRAIARLGRHLDGKREPLERAVRATRNAPAQIQTTTSQVLGLPVTIEEGTRAHPPLAHAAAVLLLSAAEGLEVRIVVAGDETSARNLATHAFGTRATDALIVDLLKELANVLMGAIKASLTSAELAFSSGIPAPLELEHVLHPPTTYAHRQTYRIDVAGAELVVQIAMRTKLHRFVLPRDLREGMVLARDLLNDRAMLLLPAGTRLTQHLLDVATPSLAPGTHVEVLVA